MNDPIPHNRSHLGYLLGFVFHPFTVFIPALAVVLKDGELLQTLAWIGFLAGIILIPTLLLIRRAKRRELYTYQRATRRPLYLTFGGSMLLSVGLAICFNAPERLVFSLLALIVWVPLQYGVNARFTKISAHTAVVAGIATAFLVMGDLNSLPLILGAVFVVLVTGWARVVTGHHTLVQVCLGVMVSVVAVLVAFGILLIL